MKVLLGWICIVVVVVVASSVTASAVTTSPSSASTSKAKAEAEAEAEAAAKANAAANANATETPPIKPRKRSTLKVFILCGQSNMQGHGFLDTKHEDDTGSKFRNGTLEWMVDTYPEKYGRLKNNDTNETNSSPSSTGNNWKQRNDVWITYNRQSVGNVLRQINQHGKLIPGYGGDPGQKGRQMGPELGFGYELGDALNKNEDENNNILLIKIGWGGRSLAVDFRPPSSGGTTGLYYESVIASIYKTLSKVSSLFPDYQSLYGESGYEISGFAWHQGWNDGCDTNMTKEYEYNLANLIRDIRIDLDTPGLPVSIGVSGMSGWRDSNDSGRREDIIEAQFAVGNETLYPEFRGTVISVETRSFFRTPYGNDTDDPYGQVHGQSPGNHFYHWNNNCESYWLVGSSMGKAMIELLKIQSMRNKFNIAFNN
jgi:alpha-galactosidase